MAGIYIYILWSLSIVCNLFVLLISDKNSPQTDEEKQRERQRNEREQKNAEIEAHNIKVNSISVW